MNFKVTLKTNSIRGYLLIRIIIGFVFLVSGLQKFLLFELAGPTQFLEMGFGYPALTAWFVGAFEVVCAVFILIGFATRISTIPLIIIMIIALFITKFPLLQEGFWIFAGASRLDLAMLLLLIFVLIHGADQRSVDRRLLRRSWLRA